MQNLTKAQKDYAVYLPAMCKPYMTGQHSDKRYPNTMKSADELNFYKPGGLFEYKWMLYSAGHATLDLSKDLSSEGMIHKRDRKNTFLLADSGGFQIGKGRWKGKWNDPKCPIADKRREQLLVWLCNVADYSMILDIPSWTFTDPVVAAKVGIYNFEDAISGTKFNNDYFIANKENDTKFMNVLQGNTHEEVRYWYNEVKDYPFSGWAFGGQVARDLKIMLEIFVRLKYDGLLEQGERDWVHILGVSRVHWGIALTKIQRVLRETHNPNLTISLDSASPFLSTVNAGLYTGLRMNDRTRWNLITERAIDDKQYLGSKANLADMYDNFLRNPVSDHLTMGDICVKDVPNKPSSWDVQSYVLLMANNVWQQINAIQEGNRSADNGFYSTFLINERFERVTFDDVVEQIFAAPTKEKSLAVIEKHARFLSSIPVGMQTKVSPKIQFEKMFAFN
jgi:hypothetical protein